MQSPHLIRDMVQDAIEENELTKQGWNPRIAKAAIFAKRMKEYGIDKEERERISEATTSQLENQES